MISGRFRATVARRPDGRRRRPSVEGLESRALMATLAVGPLTNVSRLPGAEEEATIAVNPTNPQNLFVASIGSGAGQVASVSFDGGASWATRIISNGSDGTPNACCDASAAFDSFGNLFVTYLSSSIQTVVIRSTDGGLSFTNVANLGSSDQPTIATGPGNVPGSQSVWVVYNRSGQQHARGALVTGLGAVGAFSAEQTAPDSGTGISGNFGDIAIGPNGEVAIAYQHSGSGQGPDSIYSNVDPDGFGPQGFGPRVRISTTNVGGFDFLPAQNRRSVDAEVGLAWDRGDGPFRGRLYAMYTDEAPNESNDTNIIVRFSTDDGATWGAALQANDDATTRSQFLPKIALDQTTGAIAVVWLDARLDGGAGGLGDTNGVANDEAILYGTVSVDGGATFEPNVRIGGGPSRAGSVNNSGFDYGDYIGLAFDSGVFHPIWPDNSVQLPGNTTRPNFDLATAAVTVLPTEIAAVDASWGSRSIALETAPDGLRLLPAGRDTSLPFLNIDRLTITLAQNTPIEPGDVSVTGIAVADYGPVSIIGEESTYVLTLARPIAAADRVTITIASPLIADYTRRIDVLPGDLTDDGIIDVRDVAASRNQIYGIIPATIFGDVDGDGFLGRTDYNLIRLRIGTRLPALT